MLTPPERLRADAEAVVAEHGPDDHDLNAYRVTQRGWGRRAASVAVSAAVRRAATPRAEADRG